MTFGYIMYASFVCVSPLMAWLYGLLCLSPGMKGVFDMGQEKRGG